MLLRNDVTAKFKHSLLGFFWIFIPPVCVLLIYVYMFSVIFMLRWPERDFSSRWGFGLIIYMGITIYSVLSDSIMSSIGILTSRSAMLKRVPFPYELFPISLACSNWMISGIVLWILFFLSLLTGGRGGIEVVWYFPLCYIPLFFLTAGCCWIVSALGIFIRDLGNILGILILLLFFSTPVFYSINMVPEKYRFLIELNPLSSLLANMRGILLQNRLPEWRDILLTWVIALVVFAVGYAFFMCLRKKFADVI